jgi:hypothetical protein
MSVAEVPTEAREILMMCADASEFRYEGVRRELAAKLGWRVKVLDRAVERLRKERVSVLPDGERKANS